MDDNAKNASSYHLDQEILDARGINMTVEEVAGLPTTKYSERVHLLKLNTEDMTFLKSLRRRIKNRLASQNSRRRSIEHLRRLTRELRVVKACRDDALAERKALVAQRDAARARCQRLRGYLVEALQDLNDSTDVPSIDIDNITKPRTQTVAKNKIKDDIEHDIDNIFECRIEKLVQNSVNHIFNLKKSKKVFAKTVFIDDKQDVSFYTSEVDSVDGGQDCDVGLRGMEESGVLNLSVKAEGRRSHGRKQSAPRRITCVDYNDCVLDLKIKKEPQ